MNSKLFSFFFFNLKHAKPRYIFVFKSTVASLLGGVLHHLTEQPLRCERSLRFGNVDEHWFALWILVFKLRERTLEDERPHYLHWISGSAQGLRNNSPLYPAAARCLLFCSMSYLLIYSSLPPPTTHFLSPTLKLILIYKYLLLLVGGDVIEEEMVSLHLPASSCLLTDKC